ncbi:MULTISPECIES: GPW/gp25 family protein [Burkholderia cepacia complex]|uniref:GPW/gp25 family protein n=1 Tax=Burkholderia cepacia complex TaxID=87882 RepID=UPI000756D2B0|nr:MULTISPECIES: GPW/gp25 family protein [Burkholderia cepacia complex]KVR28629.1 phage baseplate protein [Burkholderia ubonensis]KVW63446.1 phage baseplate protein [Burkholderia ubonensis]KWD17052.1 phage baseplate protein [Burkholderia ubonensis]KWD23633.1 phage baseplate protein [Burkholderia ubonensis]KWK48071.1 phage baseplate protein [Burkholderia stagnalis]
MNGTCSTTGKPLSGIAHLKQSIADILNTPKGSRVMRREYGSDLPELVDAPMNLSTLSRIYAATARAIHRWEPRFKVRKVTVVNAQPGALELDLYGTYLPDGQPVKLDGIRVA